MVGYALRYTEELYNIIIKGIIEGIRTSYHIRIRNSHIGQIKKDGDVGSYKEQKEMADNRLEWRIKYERKEL